MAKAKRQANYELLRILAMFMVVTLHYLNHTGALLVLGENADTRRLLGTLLESFCIVAVNVYVLISGYFLVEADWKIKRIINLICQVLFYAILIPLVFVLTGLPGKEVILEGGIYRWIQYLFPIGTEHYWFVTSYVLLYLFAPLLNAAVKGLSRKQLQVVICGLLLFFCIGKSFSPVQLVTDRFGYDFGWFLCMYLVAAYLRLHGERLLSGKRWAWLIYIGSTFVVFAFVAGIYYINKVTGGLVYYFTVPFHYNFILVLTASIALFVAFSSVKVPEKAARIVYTISPYTFGVYLFHEHIDIRMEWTGWMEKLFGPAKGYGIAGFLLHLLGSVLIIYGIGILIDWIRSRIFSCVKRRITRMKLMQWLSGLDKVFTGQRG